MSGEAVKVVCRCRPMNQREKDLKCETIVNIDSVKNSVSLTCLEEPQAPPKHFTFDGTYGIDSHTETIYNDVGFPLVESVVEGYNGTVFAYGQTGCGKSFSMQGNSVQKGIIPRAFEHIFEAVATDTAKKYLIRASYLEIYNENVRDLLGKDSKNHLDLHEHPEKGVYVNGLSWNECKQVVDCEKLMDKGNKNRSVGATLMNADSSRSHSIFTINVEMCESDNQGEEHYRAGKLNLVDLAGSERQSKTGATGDRLKEATKINLSLSALGNVISALVDGKSKHIPYRDSKLTRLLQDSLGGNTKTLMIAALSPAADNYEETLSTLRYANRAKNIKNKPTINEDPKDAMLRQLQDEINILKAQLAGQAPILQSQPVSNNQNNFLNNEEIEQEKIKLRQEFEEQIKQIKIQYEQEKMSKEALQKKIETIKAQYDAQIDLLDDDKEFIANGNNVQAAALNKSSSSASSAASNRKSSKGTRKSPGVGLSKRALNNTDPNLNTDFDDDENIDPAKRLLKLQALVVGGEQANNEELKKKRIKKKKYAEERKKLLADTLRNGDDDEFMLRVYDSVQEEVQFKTKLFEKEKEKSKFLENEVKDLQYEFEREREDLLDTIRKNEKQIKLISRILQKIQPTLPHDSNYYNLDKVQSNATWNEETQDWTLPDYKIEKLSFPTMGNENNYELENGELDFNYQQQHQMVPHQHALLNGRRGLGTSGNINNRTSPNEQAFSLLQSREPEIDRYRIKLENSQFNGSNYFKNRRQSELLGQTQDMKTNGRLSPLSGNTNSGNLKTNRRY